MHKFLDSTEPRLVSTVLGRTIQAKAPMPPRVHEPSGPSAGDPGPALAWLRDSFNQTRSDFKIVSATRKIESDNRVSIFVILKSPGNDTDNERNDTIKSLEYAYPVRTGDLRLPASIDPGIDQSHVARRFFN